MVAQWRPANASASYSSPLVHDRRVYVVNKTGVTFALDLDTGPELWNHRTGECWASPLAAAGRSLLLRFATRLYCIADTPGHAG